MVNFYLRDASATKETQVILFIGGRNRIKIGLDLKLKPSEWDFKKQRTKRNAGRNLFLDRIYKEVHRLKDQALATGEPVDYRTDVKAFLESMNLKPKKPKAATPWIKKYWQEFTDSKAISGAAGSIKKYNTVNTHLQAYAAEMNLKLKFDSFTLKFLDGFSVWLLKTMISSTQTKYIKIIKTFLKWAADRGYHKNKEYKNYVLKSYETDIVCLTETELMSIYKKELNTPGHDEARDLFCFECFTGLRYSDIENLKKANVKGNYLVLQTVKTKQNLKVPINRYAREILKKHKYTLPKLSGAKVNTYIKAIAVLCKIDEPTVITKVKGSELIVNTFSKHQLITTHTGRRTFITLSLEKGMRPETVMAITGHRDYKEFKKYIKLTDKILDVEMQRAWK
jgi:integrase